MGGYHPGHIAAGTRSAVLHKKTHWTVESDPETRTRPGGASNPQEVSTGRPTPSPTHKNAKSKPRAGNRGPTSYRQRAEPSGSGRPGMLINVNKC